MKDLPLVLDVTDFQENGCFYDDTLWSSASFYQNSFMSILTESSPMGPGCYVSEVVFKAIVFMHPFMIIGQPRTLEVLRHWGFDTFDDVFDNSYDLEEDMFKRIEMVIEQMEIINQLTPEELQQIKDLQSKYNQTIFEIGVAEAQRIALQEQVERRRREQQKQGN